MDLDNILKKYLRKKHGEVPEYHEPKKGIYHASACGNCLRKIFYKHKEGAVVASEDSWPHFEMGNLIEDMCEKAINSFLDESDLEYYRVINDVNIVVDRGDYKIVGETDPVLIAPNLEPVRIFEIKSTKGINFRKDSASTTHIRQVHPYMYALKAPCTIIYVQKQGNKGNEMFTEVRHDIEFDIDTISEIFSRLDRLHEYISNDELPPKKPFAGWQCEYCERKKRCDNDK